MRASIALICDGTHDHTCTATITTGLAADTPIALGVPDAFQRILHNAQASGWDIRPIATATGETTQARCPSCADRLHQHMAKQATTQLAIASPTRHPSVTRESGN